MKTGITISTVNMIQELEARIGILIGDNVDLKKELMVLQTEYSNLETCFKMLKVDHDYVLKQLNHWRERLQSNG